MKRLFLLSILYIFGFEYVAYSQPIKVHPQTTMEALDRCAPFAKKFGIEDLSRIFPGDTFPYVRQDGDVWLMKVFDGDMAWNLVNRGILYDSLIHYGAYNYEATQELLRTVKRIEFMVRDIGVMSKITYKMYSFSLNVTKKNISHTFTEVGRPIILILFFLLLWFLVQLSKK